MKIEKRYWDSCCFLGYLKGEVDKRDACVGVLKQAKQGNILIVTSALTLAEVTKLKRGHDAIPPEDAAMLQRAFKQDYIWIRNVDSYTAELARQMVWEYGFDPRDSIHVATALRHKIPYFDTFDEKLILHGQSAADLAMKFGLPNVAYQTELALDLIQSTEEGQRNEILFRQFTRLSD